MTARDVIHDAVRNALVKDGWIITDDPYTIRYEDMIVYADLAGERPVAAERAGRRIVVEVKSFVGPSSVYDLEVALGQYQLYRGLLEVTAPERELYLAVPEATYAEFFSRRSVQLIIRRWQVALLVVDTEKQVIVTWTS